MPPEITTIMQAIQTVQGFIVSIATALVALMITVAGLYIILDRDVSISKRGERLAFVKSILMGYGIILGANLLVAIAINVLSTVSGHAPPATPNVPVH